MAEMSIIFNRAQVRRIERLFRNTPKFIPQIMRNATNKTAVTIRKEIISLLVGSTGLLPSQVRRYTFLDRASLRNPGAKIRISAYQIPFAWYAPKKALRGLLAQDEYKEGGFLLGEGRNVRKKVAMKRVGRERHPIKKIYADKTLADYYIAIKGTVDVNAGRILQHHIDSQIKWLLDKQAAM